MSAVELVDGTVLKADLLITGIGSTMNSDFAKGSGLQLRPDGSLETNHFLQTNVEDVFAAGDLAFAPVWSHHEMKAAIGKETDS